MIKLDKDMIAKKIRAELCADIDAGTLGGACVCVMQNGEEILSGAFGKKSPDKDMPLDYNAVFRIASMTKSVSSAAAMILFDRGLLDPADPISKYVPAFADIRLAKKDENGQTVCGEAPKHAPTLANIMTHTSGIGNGLADPLYWQMTPEQFDSLTGRAEHISHMPLGFEPSSQEQYSPFAGFDVLGAIMQKLIDVPLAEFFKKEIFEPCEMCDTTFSPTRSQWDRMIAMHAFRDGRGVEAAVASEDCVFEKFPNHTCTCGAGLASTAADLANFGEMLRLGGVFNGRRILSEKAVSFIATPQLPFPVAKDRADHGFGTVVGFDNEPTLPQHIFHMGGAYGTHYWVDRENGITAVYLKNSRHDGGGSSASARRFIKLLYEV